MSLCEPLFSLPEITMVGGDYKEIYVHINDLDRGGSMDIANLQLNFSLIDFTNRYNAPLLKKNCEPSLDDSTAFIAALLPDDTKDFVGKYIYQFTVKAPNDKQESFQGIIKINKNINPDAFASATV